MSIFCYNQALISDSNPDLYKRQQVTSPYRAVLGLTFITRKDSTSQGHYRIVKRESVKVLWKDDIGSNLNF